MERPSRHFPEIDQLKGFAILSVVCIHAKPYAGTWLYDRVTNRAVSLFLVMFGITSELVISAVERAGAPPAARWKWWIFGRLERLMIPYWAMSIAWWVVAWLTGYADAHGLGARELVLTFLGYAPWFGTSWFVTIVLQYLLILPPWRFAAFRMGLVPALLVSAAATSASAFYLFDIIDVGRRFFGNDAPYPYWYYQWIFPPRVLFHVTTGLFVARLWGGRISADATTVFSGMALIGFWLVGVARGAPEDFIMGPLRQQAVQYLVDVPLALALLGLFRWRLSPTGLVGRVLEWCGKASWGIYLGHLWVYESFHAVHLDPEAWSNGVRVLYAVFLACAGAALAAGGGFVGKRLGLVRRRSPPVAEPSPPGALA